MDNESLRQALTGDVLKRSLIVTFVVGTLLTLINQGDLILAGAAPVIWKVLLTYCVPFLVTTYGAYSALSSNSR